ncbi:hypothetical protein D3C80_1994090 [compost metagenome]
MTAAVLINDISYGKMHQIAVLMETLAAHLIQIKQPQNTGREMVTGSIRADKRQKGFV